MNSAPSSLFDQLTLPNGARLKNRIVKSAMSDSLGDGRGNPTLAQIRLYERWAEGGSAASIIGEVQGDPSFPERPGNLVLDEASNAEAFASLATRGTIDGAHLWLQLGHAGALTPPAIGTPKGPSALDMPELQAGELSLDEILELPKRLAATAVRAERLGFTGVQIHAAHGFLLSQFLSPLFNRRTDAYGGDIANRTRVLIEVVDAVRSAVFPEFVVAVKLNSSDQLEGGLETDDAFEVIEALDGHGVDLIDISGGTYFPGASSSSDRASQGPYFLDFAASARHRTATPLMVMGGFKRREEAEAAISSGVVDVVGLARSLVLDPALPKTWAAAGPDPAFPRFAITPPGGVTAWFTMRLTEIGQDREGKTETDAAVALQDYEARDAARTDLWNEAFYNRSQAHGPRG